MNINLKNMIIIFIIFIFIYVLFSILLRKLDKIEKNEKIVYKDRPNRFFYNDIPNYIFYDDIPYMFPRRSIDINVIKNPPRSSYPRRSSRSILKRGKKSRSYSPTRRVNIGKEGETRKKDDHKTKKKKSATIKDPRVQAIVEPFSNLNGSLYPFN